MVAKRRVQVTLTLMIGSELWVRVEHAKGAFKVPGDTAATEIVRGALLEWDGTVHRPRRSNATVRIPLEEYYRLRALEG